MKFKVGDKVKINRSIFYKGCWVPDKEIYIILKLEDSNEYNNSKTKLAYLNRRITDHSNNLVTTEGLVSIREERKKKLQKIYEIQNR